VVQTSPISPNNVITYGRVQPRRALDAAEASRSCSELHAAPVRPTVRTSALPRMNQRRTKLFLILAAVLLTALALWSRLATPRRYLSNQAHVPVAERA
jgi:hypothetical protein